MLRACLALLLLTCAVSPVLAQNGRSDASVSGTADANARGGGAGKSAPQDKPTPTSDYVRPTSPATSRGGGGSDEDAVMRMRVPKWNSFLPGMFR